MRHDLLLLETSRLTDETEIRRRLMFGTSHAAFATRERGSGFRVSAVFWWHLQAMRRNPHKVLGHLARRLLVRSKRRIRRMHETIRRRLQSIAHVVKGTAAARSHAGASSNALGLLALEPRIVFDAAAVATADLVADQTAQQQFDAPAQTAAGADNTVGEGSSAIDPAVFAASAEPRNEIAFVDGSVENVSTLLVGIDPSIEVVLLDPARDGVEQIATALEGHEGLEAIHILSHGGDGRLNLGSAVLDTSSIAGQYADELAIIASALSESADILIYGCDVAAGEQGQAFVAALSSATGADIAASSDDTGSARLGGDWDLETRLGLIEAGLIDAPEWNGLLAPFLISTTSQPIVVGGAYVWYNAGTIGGTMIDLRATVLSTSGGVSGVNGQTVGDNPTLSVTTNSLGAGSAVVRWDIFAADPTHSLSIAAVGSPNITVSDIDGSGSPNTLETVAPSLNGLTGYTVNSPTALVITVSAGQLTASGTDSDLDNIPAGTSALGATRPSAGIRFSWSDVSSWTVTYKVDTGNQGRLYQHDGDGDFTFTSPMTTNLLGLDLDASNSTAAGTSYQATYIENGAGVPVVDVDAAITQNAMLGTDLHSASVKLVNAKPGDALDVGALPAGITATINTSVSGEITVSFTGMAGVASYQTALNAVTFSNTSENPNTANRLIEVSVRNGTFGTTSSVALSTITIAAVNDAPPVAVNDGPFVLVSGVATSISVLTNDSDIDSDPLAVVAIVDPANPGVEIPISAVAPVTLESGTVVALGAGGTLSVTMSRSVLKTEQFSYVVSDGQGGTAVATVSLVADADGDEIANAADIDDDNDGILDINEGFAEAVVLSGGVITPSTTHPEIDVQLFNSDSKTEGHLHPGEFAEFKLDLTVLDGETVKFIGGVGNFDISAKNALTDAWVRIGTNVPVPSSIIAPFDFSFVRIEANYGVHVEFSAAIDHLLSPVSRDSDKDGIADHLDIDSDDDGITDNVEAQATKTYILPSGSGPLMVDVDGDGLDDIYDKNKKVAETTAENSVGLLPVDTDLDAIADVIDSDSDNDGGADVAEAGHPSIVLGADSDGDGLRDVFEGSSIVDPLDVNDENVNASGIFALADTDNDTDPNGANAVPPTRDLDFRDVNKQPIIDLNSAASTTDTNRDNAVTFVDSAIGVASATLADASDLGELDIVSLTITASGAHDAANEIVAIGGAAFSLGTNSTSLMTIGGTTFSVAYTTIGGFAIVKSGGGVIPHASLDTLLRSITYDNTSAEPTVGLRTLTFGLTDVGGFSSVPAVSTIFVGTVNSAPVATDDTANGNEDASVSGNVLTDGKPDTDVDGDKLEVVSYTPPGSKTSMPAGSPTVMAGYGTLLIESNGNYTFTPEPDYNGPIPAVTYTISDGEGGTATATLTLTVEPVNDAPVATNDSASVTEDTSVSGNVLTDGQPDADADGDKLEVTGFTIDGDKAPYASGDTADIPGVGALQINGDGSYTFTPAPDYAGPVPSVTYMVGDGNGGTGSGTLTLDVMPINDPPVNTLPKDGWTTREDTTVRLDGLSIGDVDADSSKVTVTLSVGSGTLAAGTMAGVAVTGSGTGTLKLTGSISDINALLAGSMAPAYVPVPGANGAVTLTMATSDVQSSDVDTATITIDVVDDAPRVTLDANNSSGAATGASPMVTVQLIPTGGTGSPVNGVLGDGSNLTITGASIVRTSNDFSMTHPGFTSMYGATLDGMSQNAFGVATVSFSNGVAPAGTYLAIYDADSNETISVTTSSGAMLDLVQQLPSQLSGAAALPYWNPVTGTVTASTPFNNNVEFTFLDVSGLSDLTITTGARLNVGFGFFTTNPTYGDRQTTFTENGPAVAIADLDSAIFDADDTHIDSATIVLTNAQSGDALSIAGILPSGIVAGIDDTSVPGQITVTLSGSATKVDYETAIEAVRFSNTSEAPNTIDRKIVVTVNDGELESDEAISTIHIVPLPDATDDPISIDEDAPAISVNLLANDDTGVGTDGVADVTITVVPTAAEGVLTYKSDLGTQVTASSGATLSATEAATLAFKPHLNFNGTVTIPYVLTDLKGSTSSASIVVEVRPVDDPVQIVDPNDPTTDPTNPNYGPADPNDPAYDPTNPTGIADPDNLIPDVSGTDGATPVSILAGDYFGDAENEVLTFSAVGLPPGLSIDTATGTISGTLDADASQGATPGDPVGTYSVVITATDPKGNTAATTVTYAIANLAPVAVNDIGIASEDAQIVSGNVITDIATGDADTAPDSDALTVTAAMQGATAITIGVPFTTAGGGVLTLAADGSYTFEPGTAYNGLGVSETATETITYTVDDGNGATATAKLVITVVGVNDAPVAENATIETNQDNPIAGRVLASDADGNVLQFSGPIDGPAHGRVVVDPDGRYVYEPAFGFAGVDRFTVLVDDGKGGFAKATVTVVVKSVAVSFTQPLDAARDLPALPALDSELDIGGIVLDTIDQIGRLSSLPDLENGSEILLVAVNDIRRLDHAAGGHAGGLGVHEVVAQSADVDRTSRNAAFAFPQSQGLWDAQYLEGHSVRLAIDGSTSGPHSNQLVVDTLQRDRIIYVEISGRFGAEAKAAIENITAVQTDGRPLPQWARAASNGMLLLEPPIGGGELSLRIAAELTDGTVVSRAVTIQLDNGGVQSLPQLPGRPLMFDEQVQQRGR